jgi:uncharacterized protein
MRALATMLESRVFAACIVVFTLCLAVVCGVMGLSVEQDDNVLAFLPEGNAEIESFYQINKEFGGLDVALVGISSPDVFDADFLTRLKAATRDIRDLPNVNAALSLANVEDFVEDPMTGGIVASELIDHIPTSDEDEAAMRAKVMSRDHVVGRMVSEDGDAVLIYAFGGVGTPPRELSHGVQKAVEEHFPDEQKYWGGSPFISTWIYESTQADMQRLTPYAVLAIVFIILVSFRDVVGSLLALFTTVMGIVVSRAAMAFMDVPFNIVLSSMPVILFAVGSAYSIHMLSRFYALSSEHGKDEGLRLVVTDTSPVVIAAGLTTVAGLMSFATMDIQPMRTFGVYTGLGIFTTLMLSVTFVPAVIRLFPLKGPSDPGKQLRSVMTGISAKALSNRALFMGGVLALGAVSSLFVGQVDNRMDQSTFFAEGSPPDQAQTFLDEHFGGSQFLQVLVQGDMEDPHVLREIRRFSDQLLGVEHVTEVNALTEPVSMVNDAMQGLRRLPDEGPQVAVLYRFLQGNAAVSQLVREDRKAALLHIKIGSNKADALESVVADVEQIVANDVVTGYRVVNVAEEGEAAQARLADLVASQVVGLARKYGASGANRVAIHEALNKPAPPAEIADVADALVQFFLSEECFVEVAPDQAARLAKATVDLGETPDTTVWAEALKVALSEEDDVDPLPEKLANERAMMAEDLVLSAETPSATFWRQARAVSRSKLVLESGITSAEGPKGERFVAAVELALMDGDNPTALLADDSAETRIAWEINGLPVLYRGLSRSVTANQLKSLGLALVMVVIIMTVLFQSVSAGLLATAPTVLTLLVVYGGMGLMGVHLDIGTSMLASIIIGAGVDYAVHLMSAWEGETVLEGLKRAVDDTAPAIWTNALMVASGFFILTLGDSKPLQNVGGLTSAAMVVAALATFLAIPAFARKAKYGR